MPIGILVNGLSVALGGMIGAAAGQRLPEWFRRELTLVFGICSMGMGISSIGLMRYMPAVIFAVVLGTALGLACRLGSWINRGASYMEKPIALVFKGGGTRLPREEYMSLLVTVIVLFCASGTGIYGSLDSGISGDHSVLISKSILDFFTAMIFASSLGLAVPLIAVPQCAIFLTIFFAAQFAGPLITPDMTADFKACGGILLMATGLRIAKIKEFPIADMIPAMALVMPASGLWAQYILPLLQGAG